MQEKQSMQQQQLMQEKQLMQQQQLVPKRQFMQRQQFMQEKQFMQQERFASPQSQQQQQITKELLEACLQRCEHDILTASDLEEITLLWSKRASVYSTDYDQAYNTLRMFIDGHGHIGTGGFDFKFIETNSIDIKGGGWSLHISNLALFMIICLIFGLVIISALFPGVSAASLTLGSLSLRCCIM
ncbi:unnamed protein product [Rotaria sordida]|uniref:Uncharacterized protein n=1 Tax=Rotaria sordida TaxID=392033 RepID=A0A814VU52_9BILA|nr:unnamed protein product [Rotaria sordida]CAF3951905.1 unnamed protein product [Rotaria sordida]